MPSIYLYFKHDLKYPNPITMKVDLNMKFSDLISSLVKSHNIFSDYDFNIIYNNEVIPITSTNSLKKYKIKYYSQLRINMLSQKNKPQKTQKNKLSLITIKLVKYQKIYVYMEMK